MIGTLIAYSNIVSAGIITGTNGKKYRFDLKNWSAPCKTPEQNRDVHFLEDANNAVQVTYA